MPEYLGVRIDPAPIRCRRFVILVNARADGNPERNENASKANRANGNATRLQADSPQGRYESVDSKKDGDQRDSYFTSLLDNALCCAIAPCRDDPVVANCLQKVEYEKRELSCKFNEPSKRQQKNCQEDHVDVSRSLEQVPFTIWKRLPLPSYVPVCNMSSNRRY